MLTLLRLDFGIANVSEMRGYVFDQMGTSGVVHDLGHKSARLLKVD